MPLRPPLFTLHPFADSLRVRGLPTTVELSLLPGAIWKLLVRLCLYSKLNCRRGDVRQQRITLGVNMQTLF